MCIRDRFACYGDYQRDPRARIITSAYLSIVKESDVSVEAGDDAADAAWFEIEMEPETAYEEDGWEKTEYHLTIQNPVSYTHLGSSRVRQAHVTCVKVKEVILLLLEWNRG